MRRLPWRCAFAFCLVLAPSCGRQAPPEPELLQAESHIMTPGSTPESTFTAYQNATRAKDGNALWNLFSTAAVAKRNEQFANLGEQMDRCTADERVALCAKMGCTPSEIRTLSPSSLFARAISAAPASAFSDDINSTIVKTESHESVVILSLQAEDKTRRMRFVEEDGLWKVDD